MVRIVGDVGFDPHKLYPTVVDVQKFSNGDILFTYCDDQNQSIACLAFHRADLLRAIRSAETVEPMADS